MKKQQIISSLLWLIALWCLLTLLDFVGDKPFQPLVNLAAAAIGAAFMFIYNSIKANIIRKRKQK